MFRPFCYLILCFFLSSLCTFCYRPKEKVAQHDGVHVEQIPLNPNIDEAIPIGKVIEDSCSRKIFNMGDSTIGIKHIHYTNKYCMSGWEYINFYDTIMIEDVVFDVQNEVIKMVMPDFKTYYRETPVNLLISRLFKIKFGNKLYFAICFFDTNTLSSSSEDHFLILWSTSDKKVLFFGGQSGVSNYAALFGDFNVDGTLDFVSWDFGEPQIITLSDTTKINNEVTIEIKEDGQIGRFNMNIKNSSRGWIISKKLFISDPLPKVDYRN
jgi:hypothetical protein